MTESGHSNSFPIAKSNSIDLRQDQVIWAALSFSKGAYMRHIKFYIFITAMCAAVPTPAYSVEDSHGSAGRRVAMEICSHCHQVAEGQRAPLPNTPSFIAIANMPSTTALSLKVFLRSNHSRMPNFIMSNADTDDVINYILSLKQR
jgi:mono/diheme cytochrome c family protein